LQFRGEPEVCRRQGTLLVDSQNRLAGIATRGDLLRALQRDPSGQTRALDAGSTQAITAHPDEPLQDAIARMLKHDVGRLPVVSRSDPGQVVGYLGRNGLMIARSRYHEEEEIREKSHWGDLLPIRP